MNKARAMMDALMGPGRDVSNKGDKSGGKEKFKEKNVCKPFLVGFCPLDPKVLGGKRNLQACEKIHSEVMKSQFEEHEEKEDLRWEYQLYLLRDLEYAVRECDGKVTTEKARIRDDLGRKRPPLPSAVIDKLSSMKRESSAMIQRAEALDDDSIKEKEILITRAAEISKDATEIEEGETKKAQEAAVPEQVCDICGSTWVGANADAAHLQFKIHSMYKEVREKIAELLPSKEAWETKKKEKDDKAWEEKKNEGRQKRKDDWDAADDKKGGGEKDKDSARDKDKGSDKERDRDRGNDKDRGGGGRDRDRGSGGKRDTGSPVYDRGRGREQDRGGRRDQDRDRDRGGRDQDRGRGGGGRSRSRRGARR